MACLAELLLPVECTDFNVPDLLIPSGLKPGRDRFAGLPVQVDSAVHFSAHSATFAGVATCRRLTRPGGSCCAHLQPTSSCSPASLVSTGSSGTIPCYVAASRGSDDDGAAGNIYYSVGSFVSGSSVRDTLGGSECSEHNASFRSSLRSVARDPPSNIIPFCARPSPSSASSCQAGDLRPAERVLTMDELTMQL